MAGKGNNERVFNEQVKMVYSLMPLGLIASFVNGTMVAALHVYIVPLPVLGAWLMLLLCFTLLRGFLLIPANRSISNGKHIRFWARIFISGMLVSGIVWGSAAFFLFFHESQAHRILIAYVLGGMAAGAAGTFCVIRKAYLAFTIPALLPQIILFFAVNSTVNVLMGGMLLFFWILISFTAFTNRATTLSSYRLRFEREDLIASLSTARDQTQRINEALKKEIEQRRTAENELREAHAGLEQKVHDRTVEMETANSRLEQANRELSEFSRSVSHDLRSPLHMIETFSDLLNDEYSRYLDEDGKLFLSRIRMSVKRMAELIEDLLQLSRISQSELHKEQVNLSDLVHTINANLQANNPNRKIELVVQSDVVAICDSRLMRIALENLLGNAWKYTSKTDKARIEFGVTRMEEMIVYYVRDNGKGFDMAAADKLFVPFKRLHTDPAFPGTGIGLTTVMRIIQRHGGTIWADSKPDKGATFYFTLPDSMQLPRQ
ncbi:MAG: hypothetical protein GF401_05750 [Chitinivibrionales bacterium]|nr:hypothetical protein [Chitinivibrionales bacterium]